MVRDGIKKRRILLNCYLKKVHERGNILKVFAGVVE